MQYLVRVCSGAAIAAQGKSLDIWVLLPPLR